MNHIKLYESIITDYKNHTTETRVYMRVFYEMPLKQACETIEQIKNMLEMKLHDLTKL